MKYKIYIGKAKTKNVYAEVEIKKHSIINANDGEVKLDKCSLCKDKKKVYEYVIEEEKEKIYTIHKLRTDMNKKRPMVLHNNGIYSKLSGKFITNENFVKCPKCHGLGISLQTNKFNTNLEPLTDLYYTLTIGYGHRDMWCHSIDEMIKDMNLIELDNDQIEMFREMEKWNNSDMNTGTELQQTILEWFKEKEKQNLINMSKDFLSVKERRIIDKLINNHYELNTYVLKKHYVYQDYWYKYGSLWLINPVPYEDVTKFRNFIMSLSEKNNGLDENRIMNWLSNNNITMESKEIKERPDGLMNELANHYEIKVIDIEDKKEYICYFSMGSGHNNKLPPLEEILLQIAEDIASYLNYDSFEQWCGEYGYDNDSIHAKSVYDAIEKQYNEIDYLMDMKSFIDIFIYEED